MPVKANPPYSMREPSLTIDTPNESASAEKPWGDRTPDSMWDEIKSLRDENAKRRQANSRYEVIDGLADDTREVIFDFVKAVRTGDEARIKDYVTTWADSFGVSKAEVTEAIADATEEKGSALTAKELQKALDDLRREIAEQQQSADQQRQTAALADRVTQKAASLGYDREKDPIAWRALLGHAMDLQQQEGIEALAALDKAHAALEGWRQQHIDSFVANKGREAQRRPAPSTSGSAPTKDATPKNLKEARAAAEDRFRRAGHIL